MRLILFAQDPNVQFPLVEVYCAAATGDFLIFRFFPSFDGCDWADVAGGGVEDFDFLWCVVEETESDGGVLRLEVVEGGGVFPLRVRF